MLRTFIYSWKCLIRNKGEIFWNLCFPIVLGTLFYIAFGNLMDSEMLHPIPVAVVIGEGENAEGFRTIADELGREGEEQLLEISYTMKEEAMQLLEEKKVSGILFWDDQLALTVSSDMSYDQMNQSILRTFVMQYNMNYTAVAEIAQKHPENMQSAITMLEKKTDYIKEIHYTENKMDQSLSYFFNLIAMTCLLGSTLGATMAVDNQANISSLGMRKCISPVNKRISILGGLGATCCYQFLCIVISLVYFIFVLKVNFGSQLGYVLFASFVGSMTSISMGFMVGCFGKKDKNFKCGILTAISMSLCFLSGLMVGNMRIIIDKVFPLFNHINPAALISDCFYSLTIFESHSRFYENIATLLLISAVCFLISFMKLRRNRYASV